MKPDKENAKVLFLSSDLYYYLKNGEEPMCEDITPDLNNLNTLFPHGFIVGDDAVQDEATATIKVTITPCISEVLPNPTKQADDFDFDYYITLTNDIRMELKFDIWRTHVSTRWFSQAHGPSNYQEYEVETARNGDPFIRTNHGSIFWLTKKHLIPREAKSNK